MPNSSSPKNRTRTSRDRLRPGGMEEMSQRRLDVFFDFGSPFAYLLSKLLPAVAERASLDPVWRRFEVAARRDSGYSTFRDRFLTWERVA